MKIGIMVMGSSPQAGGGFTFEDDILQAFFALRSSSPHDYFLVGYAPGRPPSLDSTGLPWLSLHRPKNLRRGQKLAKLSRSLKLSANAAPLDFETYPDLARQPLDLICYLTPLTRPVADIPYITNVWDIEHRLQPFFPELSLHGEWESRERRCREIFSRATFVLTPSEQGRRELLASYGLAPDRVRILRHPTPGFALREANHAADAASPARLGVAGDFLFYPAQFWPHKNHVCLLLALRDLKDRGYRPQLVLAGSDKGNRAYVEQSARNLGVHDQIVFAGFVSRQDLVALYKSAAALVYPSFCGPENLPPLEAFALGCPVIASSIAGAKEQLAEAALLADPAKPEGWADAILRLKEKPDLRSEHIALGKKRAATYTADHFVRDLFGIFDEFTAYRRCWP